MYIIIKESGETYPICCPKILPMENGKLILEDEIDLYYTLKESILFIGASVIINRKEIFDSRGFDFILFKQDILPKIENEPTTYISSFFRKLMIVNLKFDDDQILEKSEYYLHPVEPILSVVRFHIRNNTINDVLK